MLDAHLIAKTDGKAKAEATVEIGELRITVLTPRTVRVERGAFTDCATQAVWYRNLPSVPFEIKEEGALIRIVTQEGEFAIEKGTGDLKYAVRDGKQIPFDPADNRKGTARTLDQTNGSVKLEDGLISVSGVSCLTDDTLLLGEDGMVAAREPAVDRYYFNCASERQVLKDYYTLTGFPPLPPRYALGNWWSRYWAYSAQEYTDLLRRFKEEDIPFWVATIDMDWHWVKVLKKFGYWWGKDRPYQWNPVSCFIPGWTGFSFNTDLFPDHRAFLKEVREMGYHIPLNLHPADGVRRFETQYQEMCKEVGQDPTQKKAVCFDITSDTFLNAYFKVLMKPLERDGVDFWWIDWQQGKNSKLKGYDPLWACNHYHTLDAAAGDKRPLILSRYAGAGSQRYPLGFSGDTYITWKSLAFQPYFTANATNAGYPAWSHDIGGHMMGNQKDDELYLRWLQFGVFSPVMRLHSNNLAISKEPWNHPKAEKIAKEWLRLRHKLVPYIYSETARTALEGIALIEPMYYRTPCAEAEKAMDQYWFGSELLVAPIVTRAKDGVGCRNVWFPAGTWTDLFTDEVQKEGLREVDRDWNSIPVYLKEGGILPMQDDVYEQGNPTVLTVWTAKGNGCYSLYEDDNETEGYRHGECHFTKLTTQTEHGIFTFTKHAGEGVAALVPAVRRWSVKLPAGYTGAVSASVNGVSTQWKQEGRTVTVDGVADGDTLTVTARGE